MMEPRYQTAGVTKGMRANYRARQRYNARAANIRTGGFLGLETKFYDTSKTDASFAAPTDASGGELDPATVDCISAPAQGDTEQSRDGNRIVIKSAQVTGIVTLPAEANLTAGEIPPVIHLALVQDAQSNGATLSSEDVYTNPSGSATTAASPLRNLQYSSRFRVLAQWQASLPVRQVSYDGTNIETDGVSIPFRLDWSGNMPVQFKGGATAAGVSGVADNSIHVIGFCSTTAQAPRLSYNARIRFQG